MLNFFQNKSEKTLDLEDKSAISNQGIVDQAFRAHRSAIELIKSSRESVYKIYPYADNGADAGFQQLELNKKILEVLERYLCDDQVYKYFYGYPY